MFIIGIIIGFIVGWFFAMRGVKQLIAAGDLQKRRAG